MEKNREFERLIEKSRAQIDEREKMIKELIELNEIEEKRRKIEQLTSENALLENESKRLKDLIRQNSETLQENAGRRDDRDRGYRGGYQDRNDRNDRGRGYEPVDPAAELLELTREIRNELALNRAQQNINPLRSELDSLRHEIRNSSMNDGHGRDLRDSGSSTVAERQNMIRKLNQEISQIEKNIESRRNVDNDARGSHPDITSLLEETRKIRVDLDKQKQDNTKRDRDMSRVISLIEKMSQDND